MSDVLRTFLAVSVPCSPEIRRTLRLLGEMGTAIRPASADSLHITVKFLGETSVEQLPETEAIVSEAVADATPFEMQLVGLGAFPTANRPSVVWAGVEGGEPLIEIAGRLQRNLKRLGFAKERRSYTPHLTLARIRRKPPQQLFDLLDDNPTTPYGPAPVDAVKLYQSDLGPDGAKYTVRWAATLPASHR